MSCDMLGILSQTNLISRLLKEPEDAYVRGELLYTGEKQLIVR